MTKNSMEAKETFEDGSYRNYANSHFFSKLGNMQSVGVGPLSAVQNSQAVQGESTDGLAAETDGNINSALAGCEGMATTITAAHYSIWRHLYDSMLHKRQKASSSSSRLTKKLW